MLGEARRAIQDPAFTGAMLYEVSAKNNDGFSKTHLNHPFTLPIL